MRYTTNQFLLNLWKNERIKLILRREIEKLEYKTLNYNSNPLLVLQFQAPIMFPEYSGLSHTSIYARNE